MDLITGLTPILLQGEQQPNAFVGFLPMILMMFLIMYFLMIRPQQKKEKERKAMLEAMQKNDRVLTSGGILGTIVNLQDEEVTLRIDETNNVRVRFSRDAIIKVFRDEAEA